MPILWPTRRRGVVGALHAGWRGTLADIAAAGVRAMVAMRRAARRDPRRARSAIGACCFEVDAALADRFARRVPHARQHTQPGRPARPTSTCADLSGISSHAPDSIRARIATVGPCTECAGDRYFSRRAAGGAVTGLQMSFIGMKP